MNENEILDEVLEEPNVEEEKEAATEAFEPCVETDATDYSETADLLEEDLSFLRESFPELSSLADISGLPNPTRYAALRDLGLTPEEAYLATAKREARDNRAHLRAAVPAASKPPYSSMTRREWQAARELFEDMSDSEIEKLYRKVTK